LAHADELIDIAGNVLFDYLQPGPLQFETVVGDGLAHVVIAAVHPLPLAVARYTADALTTLRAAIEHTLYAEVEDRLGRSLVGAERQAVEMPACTTAEDFSAWLKNRGRSKLVPFADRELVKRIEDLQPFQMRDPDDHPMRVLAEHTNFSKHRAPAIANTRLGRVTPHTRYASLNLPSIGDGGQPIAAGDVIATGPEHLQVPLDIWPQVSIQRPHTGSWRVLLKELEWLEEWVRKAAVPILVTGSSSGVDALPPQFDTMIGHKDIRAALSSAGTVPAVARSLRRIGAAIARDGMVETLALHTYRPERRLLKDWAYGLSDDEILERHGRLAPALNNPQRLDAVVMALIREAVDAGVRGA
jgi:hypothetical protein